MYGLMNSKDALSRLFQLDRTQESQINADTPFQIQLVETNQKVSASFRADLYRHLLDSTGLG